MVRPTLATVEVVPELPLAVELDGTLVKTDVSLEARLSLLKRRPAARAPIDVAGIVLSAPPLDIPVGNPLQKLFAPLLSKYTPNLGVLALDSSMISRDPAVVAAYDADPLVYRGKVPARTGAEILRATDLVKQRLDRVTAPLLVLHGTADGVVPHEMADALYAAAGSREKKLVKIEGGSHSGSSRMGGATYRDAVLAFTRRTGAATATADSGQ